MNQRFEVNRVAILGLVDLAMTLLALYLASWARYLIPWGERLPWQFVALPWPVYLMAAFIWPAVFSLTAVYETRARSRRQLPAEMRLLLWSMGLALLALAGALYFSYRQVPRRLFLYFGLIDLAFLAAARAMDYLMHRKRHAPRLLIAGAGRIGEQFARQVQRLGTAWQVIGFLDDSPDKVSTTVAGAPVLGTLDALRRIVQEKMVDEVIFALPLRAHERLMRLVLDLERLPVEVSVVPDYFDLAFFRTGMEDLLGMPLIRLRASAIEGRARVVKRLFDLAIAVPGLVFCLPLFALITLAIRLDSPGPVLFRQQRVGENGRLFNICKFRTMVQDAEGLADRALKGTDDGQVLHKSPDDPRVTRVGRFLRRFSLDELPQLWNVAKGEMSLVGPRPELPWLVDRYEDWQRKRFAVPPGITGWWQISGRSDRPMHLHVEDDIYYIQNYSIWLDLRILWHTVGVVLKGQGAY
jgi:exopolysaccharide biosynthesis polyprenyl glycosylphosphotransferase